MTEEKNRTEKKPENTETQETRERETGRTGQSPEGNWEEEKQQGKELVSKALNKVKKRLEEQ